MLFRLNLKNVLNGFLILHLLTWTLLPYLVRFNLPMDAIEGSAWGLRLDWGYDKNPFLNAWLSTFANVLDHYSEIGIYLFSQLSVIIAMLAVWLLARKMVTPHYAIIAVLLLETMQYYNFHAIDFNDNILELSLWPLTILGFYSALTENRYRDWCFTGICAGFSMMAKYYTLVLLAAMVLFLVREKKNHVHFFNKKLYFGLAIFFLIITPHVIWLTQHHYITISYVFERAATTPHWNNHLYYPLKFASDQGLVFLPTVLFLSLLRIGQSAKEAITSSFNQRFLFYNGFMPFMITLAISLLLGINLRAGWGMPLLGLWPLLFMVWFKPKLSIYKTMITMGAVVVFMFCCSGFYVYSLTHTQNESSANFPGKELAHAVTKIWANQFSSPLHFVAGPRWLTGNVSYYAKDHPLSFMEADPLHCPQVKLQQFKKEGGIILWDKDKDNGFITKIKTQFKNLSTEKTLTLFRHREQTPLNPIKIGVILLKPQPDSAL